MNFRLIALFAILLLFSSCIADEQLRSDCHDACATLDRGSCLEPAEFTECEEKCDVQSITTIRSFKKCVDKESNCAGVVCLTDLGVQAGSAPPNEAAIDRCRRGCNNTAAVCDDDTRTEECLAACDSGSAPEVIGFADCTSDTNSCQENTECYETLGI